MNERKQAGRLVWEAEWGKHGWKSESETDRSVTELRECPRKSTGKYPGEKFLRNKFVGKDKCMLGFLGHFWKHLCTCKGLVGALGYWLGVGLLIFSVVLRGTGWGNVIRDPGTLRDGRKTVSRPGCGYSRCKASKRWSNVQTQSRPACNGPTSPNLKNTRRARGKTRSWLFQSLKEQAVIWASCAPPRPNEIPA